MDTGTASEERQELSAGVERAPGSASRLWRNRGFNILWAGQTLSALGDAFALVALPLLVLAATGSVAQMGLVTGVYGVGQLVAGLFAGMLVDRMDRRGVMIVCDSLRFALYAALPVWWALAGPALWLIYVVSLFGALLGMTFQVAYMTAIANLVDRDQLTDANGRLQATYSVAYVVGPLLAGVITGRAGAPLAIGVDAVTFAISAASLLLIRLRTQTGDGAKREGKLSELLAGARYLWSQPALRAITWLTVILMLLVGGGIDLFIYHLKHDLRQGDEAVGVVLGLASVGAALGSTLAPWLRRRAGFGVIWIGGLALSGLALALIGPAPTLWAVAALAMGFTLGDSLRAILQITLRQELTPDHLLGRVTSAFWTLGAVPTSFGAALTAGVAQRVGTPLTLLGMGLGVVALALLAPLTPVRDARPETSA